MRKMSGIVKSYAFELKRVIATMRRIIYLIETVAKNGLFSRCFRSPFAFVYVTTERI
jgi:hypothetical protein